MTNLITALVLAVGLAACGSATTNTDQPQTAVSQADELRDLALPIIDFEGVSDALVDEAGNATCDVSGSQLTNAEAITIASTIETALGTTFDEGVVLGGLFLAVYCPEVSVA